MKPDLISNDCQLDSSGKLIHLLGLKGLPKKQIENILDVASGLLDNQGNLKKSKTLGRYVCGQSVFGAINKDT